MGADGGVAAWLAEGVPVDGGCTVAVSRMFGLGAAGAGLLRAGAGLLASGAELMLGGANLSATCPELLPGRAGGKLPALLGARLGATGALAGVATF